MNTYRFKIGNYHSIGKADIALNGITVLAGVNGSGKSTLARWLYYIVNETHNYDSNCLNEYKREIADLISQYEIVVLSEFTKENDMPEMLNKARQSIMGISYATTASLKKIIDVYSDITKRFAKELKKSFVSMNKGTKTRIMNFLQMKTDDDLLEKFLTIQLSKAASAKKRFVQQQNKRPILKFYERIKRVYNESDYPLKMSFKEDGFEIIKKSSVGSVLRLDNAIYIDTPMALSVTNSDNPFWNNLRKLLSNNIEGSDYDKVVSNLLKQLRSITGGKVTDKKDIVGDEELCFTRESDKLTIKLENTATGIKTFAYLDRLLENGYLNRNTILVIDEPEVHLHPQWIVEFARMLILIHKETGLYVTLASHNPDMVSAIRYVAEKEGVLDKTSFYLAEQDKGAETFTYKDLGQDIEPIFASFNKSFELIEKYGQDNN